MSMPHQENAPQRKKSRPARVKHVPVRTCISCRESGAKRGLTRIVRTPDGLVRIDPTGKMNGRGAYLCTRPACWVRATTTPILARALNVELAPETIDELKEFAADLTSDEEVGNTGADSKESDS